MDLKKYKRHLNFINQYKKAINASTGSEVDSNANVENKNVTTLYGEIFKRVYKLGEAYSNTGIKSPVYLVNKLHKRTLYKYQ